METSAADSLRPFAVVDLFAGPGGLAEGFSALEVQGKRPFTVELSVEMEELAHRTLLLRTFLREFDQFPGEYYDWLNSGSAEPDWAKLYPAQMARALRIAQRLELGNPSQALAINTRISRIRNEFGDNTILIGGPPCQAYSLVGRARNAGNQLYRPAADGRHFLYQAYIDVLARLKPAVFVMENVKGILSSTVNGRAIFRSVLQDLSAQGYRLVALHPPELGGSLRELRPQDFIVRAEDHGLPQARHRVFVIGVRRDVGIPEEVATGMGRLLKSAEARSSVRDVLTGLPRLRSGLSGDTDGSREWKNIVLAAAKRLKDVRLADSSACKSFRSGIRNLIAAVEQQRLPRTSRRRAGLGGSCPADLALWIHDPLLSSVTHHDTRSHMASDLGRYLFAALFAEATGRSPKASDFPKILAPEHANWRSGKFADRFRAQLWDRPATTITSHIGKDGHYYIHPEARQCRSLTVREAARIQTFPDNYVFKGNRTQQYVQIGNAVPPFLALRIAEVIHSIVLAPSVQEQAGLEDAA